MPTVWGIGHAGGAAASVCVRKSIDPAAVDPDELRALLTAQGAYL